MEIVKGPAALFVAAKRWGGAAGLHIGGNTTPRPSPCAACGRRYRHRRICAASSKSVTNSR